MSCLLGASSLLLGCGSGTTAAHHDPVPAPSFGPAQRRAFDILRGSTHPVPPVLRSHLRQARNPQIRGLWPGAAKYIATDTGLWAVNGPGKTCILQTHGGAIGCESRPTLLREGVALGVVTLGPPPRREPREFVVAGIVPNQVRAVELRVGNRTRRIAVHENAYSLRAPVPIVVERLERREPTKPGPLVPETQPGG